MICFVQSMLEAERRKVDALWLQRIDAYARRMQAEWEIFYPAIDVANDLPVEELAPLFVAFRRLREMGVRFDPRFVARIEYLEATAETQNPEGDREPDCDAEFDWDRGESPSPEGERGVRRLECHEFCRKQQARKDGEQ